MCNLTTSYLRVSLAICAYLSCGQFVDAASTSTNYAPELHTAWVDTLLSSMSLEEKIGQLFIIRSSVGSSHNDFQKLVEDLQPSGVLLQNLPLSKYIETINEVRNNSEIPLLEISDQPISVHNQFSDLADLPSPATLSAIEDSSVKDALSYQLLKDLTTLGFNCSFSPNIHTYQSETNQYSPLHNEADAAAIMNRVGRTIRELRKRTILPILQGLEMLNDSNPDFSTYRNQIAALEKNGLAGAYFDSRVFEGNIQTKQPAFLKKYLQENLHFEGIIIGEINEAAPFIDFHYAGADQFIVSDSEIRQVINQVKYLVKSQLIPQKTIDEKVIKILLAKSQLGLPNLKHRSLNKDLVASKIISSPDVQIREIYEKTTILIPNKAATVPLPTTYGKSRHLVHVSQNKLRTLQNTIFQYANINPIIHRPKKEGVVGLMNYKGEDAFFIVALDNIDLHKVGNQGFVESLHQLSEKNTIAIVNFGNPFNLQLFSDNFVLVQCFENNDYTQNLAIQLLFGGIAAEGRLPTSISTQLPYGYRYQSEVSRLRHAAPEQVGMSRYKLSEIDEIVTSAIQQRAMPGCQILIAKSGNIVYSNAFGYHTYKKQQRVEKTDLYDVASITKVAATTLAMMKLYEEQRVAINQSLSDQMFLPENSSIRNITLKQLLTHKSGLQKNMPIAPYLNNRNGIQYFNTEKTEQYTQQVANNFYFDPKYQTEIWEQVNQLEQQSRYLYRKSVYSDVNFYLLQQFIESKVKKGLDEYIHQEFYQPLGLRYCLFNPLKRFPEGMIVPTEEDHRWRHDLLKGYVHDETAALHGGVGGNAGLFANAEDLVVLFQMLLNGGTYGGKDYLKSSTINHFTSAKHGNHRGLGFDKRTHSTTVARRASPRTYGHNGFTGTCVWVDPENELIYIFLANRIHPNVRNNALSKLSIRRKIHEIIYDAMDKEQATELLLVNVGEAE